MRNNRRKFLAQAATVGLMPLIPAASRSNEPAKGPESSYLHLPDNFKGKNKVGFNLLLWTASISEKMNPVADRLKQIGYDGIEVSMGELKTQPYIDYGKYLKSLDLDVTSVFATGVDEDAISSSKAVREKALEKMKWAVDRSNDLGSKVICGPMHSAFAHFSRQPPTEDQYKWSAEVLHKAGEYAAQSNVIFAVEALNRFECYLCNTMEQLLKLVKMADHPHVTPLFDTHHANIEEKSNQAAIESLRGKLTHVHISENDRGTPGDGHIKWDDIFSSLSNINYKGWITIESFSRNDPSFANAINVWRNYSEPWDVATKGLKLIKSMQAKYNL